MRLHISPGVCQILCGQSRIIRQKIGFRYATPPRVFQNPNENSRVGNPSRTAANTFGFFYAFKLIAQIARQPLQKFEFFGAGHFGKFDLLNCVHTSDFNSFFDYLNCLFYHKIVFRQNSFSRFARNIRFVHYNCRAQIIVCFNQ